MKKTTFPGAVIILGIFITIFFINQSESFGLEEDLIITSSSTDLTCYNADNGAIDIDVSGGNGNYSYQWTGPNFFTSSTEDISNLAAGTYTVSITDDAGNSGRESIIISQPEELVLDSFSTSNVSCNGFNDGAIIAESVSGGTAPYQYSIDGTSFSTNSNFQNLSAGNYTLTVRDANNCSIATNIEITQPDQLTMTSPSSQNVSCFGGNDGSISAGSVSGGTSPYQYSINGTSFSTNSNFQNLSAGNYTLTVRDVNNCSISTNIQITQPDQLTMTAPSSQNVSCFGGNDGSISAGKVSGGTSPYQYSIDGTSFSTNSNFDNLSAGNYTLTVRDQNNCSISRNIQITQPDQLEMTTPDSQNVSCFGGNDGSISAGSVSGGTSPYQYSINGTSFSTNSNFQNLSAGNYTLTVRDANNCSISRNIEITQPDQLTMTAPSSQNVSCFGGNDGSISAGTVSGGTSPYQYSIDGNNFSTSSNFQNLSAGNYTLTLRDANNCSIATNIQITQPDQLEMTTPDSQNVSCFGGNDGSISAGSVSGGTSPYQYSINGTSFSTNSNFQNLSAGNYTLTVRDVNNCSISTNIQITQPDQLTMTAPSSQNVSCFGGNDGSISAGKVSGGTSPYQYSINGTSFSTNSNFDNLSAGNYTLTVRDQNNCSISRNIQITQPDQLEMTTPDSQNVSCFGGNDGSISAGSVSGGTSPYQYSINGTSFSTNSNFQNLSAGNYTLTVRDANNCSISRNIEITQPDQLTMTAPSSQKVSCFGGNDGSISAGSVSGGTSPYQYSINGTSFSTNSNFQNLSAGNYTLTVRDANNCSISRNIEITQPDQLTMTAPSSQKVSCFGGNNGSISAGTVSGGISPYQYSIDGTTFSTNSNFDNLSAGNYTLTVRDANNCSIATNIQITQPDQLEMTAPNSQNVSCFGGNDGSISAGSVSGGTSPYQYSIDGTSFSTNSNFQNLSAGNYTLTVRDQNNCSISTNIEITQPDQLKMTAPSSQNVSCFGGNDGSITAGSVSGGTSPYQYSIDGINYQSNRKFSNLFADTYSLTILDNNGCTISQTIQITQPNDLTASSPSVTNVNCFGTSTGKITAGEVNGGTAPFEYSIDNTNFQTDRNFTGLSAGTYTLFIKDANACGIQQLFTIEQPDELISNYNKTDVNCYKEDSGIIQFTKISGGSGRFEFSIDNGLNWSKSAIFENLKPGSYTLKLRDENNINCQKLIAENIIISEPSAPVEVSVSTTRTTVFNSKTGTAEANPTGGTPGYTYEWRAEGNSTILATTKKATNLAAGNYKLSVYDKNGCTKTIDVVVNELLKAEILPTSICEGENNVRVSYFEVANGTAYGGVAPYSYTWDFDNDGTYTTDTGLGPHRVTYPSEGNRIITLTVTDAEGFSQDFIYQQYVGECYVDNCGSNDFGIAGYYIGDASGTEITSENCNDGVQKYIYVQLDQNTSRYSLYTEFTYSVKSLETNETTIIREFGCFYEREEIPINARAIPINYQCGDEVSIDNIYLTFSNNKKNACGQSSKSKCFSTNNQEIVFTPLYAKATPNELECYDSELGTIRVQASGGRAPYSYSITSATSGYQKENLFEILKAGSYDVWVKDSEANIFKIPSVVITQPESPITMEFEIQQPVCPGDNATVTVNPSGGTPKIGDEETAYEYLWNDASGSTTKTLNNLEPGQYTITVIDANQCQAIRTINITEPEQLTTAITGEDKVLGCGYYQTTLEANTPEFGSGIWSVVSGPANYNFINPSDPNTNFIGDEGQYVLRWTVFNENCSNYDELNLTISANCNSLDFDGKDDHILIGDSFGMEDKESFTIEAWIKSESNTGIKTILSKRDIQNINAGGYDFIINSGSPTFRWNGNSVSTSHKISEGIWHHVAVIYKNGNIKLYVDGIPLANKDGNLPTSVPYPFIIGAVHNSTSPDIPSNYFDGWIEELRIWNKSLTEKQLRFLMNQHIAIASNPLRGNAIPIDVPGSLNWNDLEAYYQLKGNPEAIAEGLTPEITGNHNNGLIRNITSTQENTAPLPYILNEENQDWTNQTTWYLPTSVNDSKVSEREVWKVPGSYGIDGQTTIDWNIVEISKDIFYPYANSTKPLQVLGLISNAGALNMMGINPPNGGTGNPLVITDYLKLNGIIDLNGESQLIQTEGSILDPNSTGFIQRDQQGTANSFNYNYWSSPVSSNSVNSGFTIGEVLKDGTDPDNIQDIAFKRQFTWADSKNYTGPKRISTYWLNKFHQIAIYSGWEQINENTKLKPGEGYTMKGTSGSVDIFSLQNYTFKGLPNNGNITLGIEPNEIYLIGNPYPSALDGEQFILDNLDKKQVNGATGDKNLFNGAIYLWDHFGDSNSHYLKDYVGGYATLNLIGSVPAIATDELINANNTQSDRRPGKYIPVGQGFFVNSYLNAETSGNITISSGDILFRNEQRVFAKETNSSESHFLKPETKSKKTSENKTITQADTRQKIRLNYKSPGGMYREIVVGADENATSEFDLGYDAPLYDMQKEDMFWLMKNQALVIQGVPDFNSERVLDLGVIVRSSAEFYIEIDSLENISSEKEIYLLDRQDSTYFDLRAEKFVATIDSGYYDKRFAITFQKIEDPTEEEPTEEEQENDDDDVSEEDEDTEGNGDETDGESDEEQTEDDEDEAIDDDEKPEPPETPDEDDSYLSGKFRILYLREDDAVYIENPERIEINNILLYGLNGSFIKEFKNIPLVEEIYIPLEKEMSSAVYILKINTAKGVTNLKFVRK
ncbi:LamG-like jellyroll fold domain-containing protein [Zunongwangia sp. HRR-M8]|uniref:LamG-like jellyroll fold domain-containing protein n=1 Tax=Zunongwangia sp. HRR-M8 TaxID=3015170 RepID=UPI0022DDFD8B|nr:LamG-like jellyroll fold domain-containing protein [Zunongwangia sp. HRR-M8]WBL21533.1 LamG domain-containing protein [Zunongwangia sp. HRR-M8]